MSPSQFFRHYNMECCARARLTLRPGDEVEDLLRKGDHDAARDGEHTVGPLGGVVGLEGQAHLEDAITQQDEAHGTDQGEDEIGQVGHYVQGVAAAGGEGGHDKHGGGEGQTDAQGVQPLGSALELIVFQMVHVQFPPFQCRLPGRTGPRRKARFWVSSDGECRAVRRRPQCGRWRGASSSRTSGP